MGEKYSTYCLMYISFSTMKEAHSRDSRQKVNKRAIFFQSTFFAKRKCKQDGELFARINIYTLPKRVKK